MGAQSRHTRDSCAFSVLFVAFRSAIPMLLQLLRIPQPQLPSPHSPAQVQLPWVSCPSSSPCSLQIKFRWRQRRGFLLTHPTPCEAQMPFS